MRDQVSNHHYNTWASSFGSELQTSTNASPGEHSAPDAKAAQLIDSGIGASHEGSGFGFGSGPDHSVLLNPAALAPVTHSQDTHQLSLPPEHAPAHPFNEYATDHHTSLHDLFG
jgi:hypothetical protein